MLWASVNLLAYASASSHTARVKRSAIPEPLSIDKRPAIVDARARFGDWGIDTVLGKNGTGALVTLAERKSRLYLVRRVDSKRATDVRDAVITMLTPYADHVHTITADNGSEFVEHQAIAKALNTEFYFAPHTHHGSVG